MHETESGILLGYSSATIEKNEDFEEIIKVSFLDLLYKIDPDLEKRLERIVGNNRRKQLYCLYNIERCDKELNEEVIPTNNISVKSMLESLSKTNSILRHTPKKIEITKVMESLSLYKCIDYKSNLYYSFITNNVHRLIGNKVKIKIKVANSGKVLYAKVLNNKFFNENLKKCLEEKIKSRRFPRFLR